MVMADTRAGVCMRKYKVLITGASGFIGKAICTFAERNKDWDIYAWISGRRKVLLPDGIHVVTGDLRQPDRCDEIIQCVKPDVLLHLAWNLEDRNFLNNDANIQWIEVSLHLLRAFIKQGGRKFVFSGSSAEYGYEQEICKEGIPGKPVDLYGLSKLKFEEIAEQFCKLHHVQFASLRFFSVYGPGEEHLLHVIPLAINQLLQGKHFVCKGPNNVWDYIYIDDAAQAAIQVMQSDFFGTINIGSGVGSSMRDVFVQLAEAIGRKDLLLFENEQATGKKLVADMTRMQELGYESSTKLQQGLLKTVMWWKTMM
ncbi:MAG: NAD(P)-dependent oxidoreductase [Agathobaculum sp.]|uniref:NAD-dependent epimerase/dehydratase family protein n=1 Tax=Agathobaculum sp. TaxID=2048138 RepID=UPI0025BB444A|nr:NAD(P)-dependent oxidoreductase [Agathobaculum sp.]MCI7126433.1 NAD(P)-dependent oxidoreductase [Agathobaculum sp.]MDY3712398.1 NAD(P)-dependent oxidoreductase [Agathobaculum sp.]